MDSGKMKEGIAIAKRILTPTKKSLFAMLVLTLTIMFLRNIMVDETLQKKAQYRGEYYDTNFKARQDEFLKGFDSAAEEYANQKVLEYTKNKLTANAAGVTETYEPSILESESRSAEASADYPRDFPKPSELWYVFADARHASGEVYYSGGFDSEADSYKDHLQSKRGGLLAIDIGTSGKSLIIRAPDHRGESKDWTVATGVMEKDGVGKYITLSGSDGNRNVMFLIGHVSEYNVKAGDTVRTGQAIGKSGGCPGMKDQGVSTGCHVHLEYYVDGSVTPYTPVGEQYKRKVGKVSSEKPELLKKPYNESGLAALSRAMADFENSTYKNNPGGMKRPYTFDCENYTVVTPYGDMAFDTENDGWECMSRSLRKYRNKDFTVRELIEAWTDTTKEREENYIAKVTKRLAVSDSTKLHEIF